MAKTRENTAVTDPSGFPTDFEDVFSTAPKTARIHLPHTLAETMTVSLVLNPESKIWLLHDKPFEDFVLWAEYDVDAASLSLILNGGKVQGLGMKIHPPVRKYLREARQLFTVLLRGQETIDAYIVPLLVRETGHHKI